MFRFFRQIRLSLLTDNRRSRYLLYALGEIFLVVIGILLALQIDTWNTERMDRLKEREYLRNLIEDLDTQQVQVNAQIEHETLMRAQCQKALKHLSAENIDIDSVNRYLASVTRRTFVVNDPTFQDLKSSGNILIIRDNTLRKTLLSFYQYLEYSALVIKTDNETSVAGFRDFLIDNRVVNMNYTDTLEVAAGVDFSIDAVDVPWAKTVQEELMKDKPLLLVVLNRVGARGRTSSVHLDLMNRLQLRIKAMKQEIVNYLGT
jgi:hypothetical protein